MFQQGGFNGNIEDEEGEVIGGAVLQQFLQKAPALINELDEVVCGLAIAADGKSAHLDCRLTAAAGSATARKFARLKGTTTLLAGFGLPDAAVTAHWVAAMDDFDLAQATNSLAGFQAQAARRLDDSEDLTKDQAGWPSSCSPMRWPWCRRPCRGRRSTAAWPCRCGRGPRRSSAAA